jgi:CBS domain-containing protein
MNAKIKDLMAEQVVAAQPHHTVDHLRGLMERNKISAVPVVGPDGEAVGIVTSTDLIADLKGGTPVSQIMSERVYAVPAYNDVHVAARVMRKHKIHHVVVTHEKEVVGIVSAFDLLQLVEEHRFVMKGAPGAAKGSNAQSGSAKGSKAARA